MSITACIAGRGEKVAKYTFFARFSEHYGLQTEN